MDETLINSFSTLPTKKQYGQNRIESQLASYILERLGEEVDYRDVPHLKNHKFLTFISIDRREDTTTVYYRVSPHLSLSLICNCAEQQTWRHASSPSALAGLTWGCDMEKRLYMNVANCVYFHCQFMKKHLKPSFTTLSSPQKWTV